VPLKIAAEQALVPELVKARERESPVGLLEVPVPAERPL
jgi:hypothetical protein